MRSIPITLQAHLEQAAQTTCLLLKYVCRDGDVYGYTDHDRAITYDDGLGEVAYQQRAGFEMSQLSATAEMGVDNAEAPALIPVFDLPDEISPEQIHGGKLDGAEFWIYLVNYEDLDTSGSPYVPKHSEMMCGTVGQVRMENDQLVVPELRSLSAQMGQTITPLTSLTCRLIFGSPECGVDADALWDTFTVTAVGAESDRTYTITGPELNSPAIVDDRYQPGLTQFLTGDNAQRYFQVESNVGQVITQAEATRFPVQVGDTGRIRPDCRKRFLEDCIGIYANGLNFDGEPNLPINDEDLNNAGDL